MGMRDLRLFTKIVAMALVPVFLLVQASPLLAAGGVSTIAIIGPPAPLPADIQTVWTGELDKVNADPLLLVKDENATEKILLDWLEETSALEESTRAAALGLRGRAREVLDDAWAAYYRFDFNGSLNLLGKVTTIISALPDSALQADALFKSLLLEGMDKRALGDDHFDDAFIAAAAIRPDAKLTRDRYSPEIIQRFEIARGRVISGPRSTISIEGDPPASLVIIDGREMGNAPIQGLDFAPGPHFIEIQRPGYEADRQRIILEKWQTMKVRFHLSPAGPTAPPEKFFADRVMSGDNRSLAHLALKLGVDYVVLGWIDEDELKVTLIDSEGAPVSQGILTIRGKQPPAEPGRLLSMLEPLEWDNDSEITANPGYFLNVPEAGGLGEELSEESVAPGHIRWYLLLGGAVLLAVVAGSAGSGGGGTQVEVTW
ncbi:MAG TPA: PEGA domain-containing protein [Proteobacteria bacterium]|nr:PEGA domain protein [bacterium BMS3Abin14]HDL54046.1 PEGA domain-containing protein [Pseudomonadota bacterium]